MEKVVITGGAGFIGSHLAEVLQDRYEVFCYDDMSTGKEENLSGIKCTLMKGSILDRVSFGKILNGTAYCFHLAGMTSVARSIKAPQECEEQNVEGLINVLEACVSSGVKKFILASSASVYGESVSHSRSEIDSPNPRSPYAISKLTGEYYSEIFRQIHGLASVSLRLFNVYGPRQSAQSDYASVIPQFFENAMNGRKSLIYGDGEQVRDFVFVRDVVEVMKLVAEDPRVSGTINVGTGRGISIRRLCKLIYDMEGNAENIDFAEERPGDIRSSVANIARAEGLGIAPRYALEEGLVLTHQHLLRKAEVVS